MPIIIELLKEKKVDRLIILLGKRETYKPVLAFYKKVGFKRGIVPK